MLYMNKVLIIGHGRHGKDTVAEILRDYHGRAFVSSSLFCADFVRQGMEDIGVTYPTPEACYEDRHNHRDFWFNSISEYNTPDKSRTAREMLEQGNDIYVGMRNREEFESCKKDKLFDCVVWVDRSTRRLNEPASSMELKASDADIVLNNNFYLRELWLEIDKLVTDNTI